MLLHGRECVSVILSLCLHKLFTNVTNTIISESISGLSALSYHLTTNIDSLKFLCTILNGSHGGGRTVSAPACSFTVPTCPQAPA